MNATLRSSFFTHMVPWVSFLLMLLIGCAAFAQAPLVRGQRIRDFARITFEWPEKTEFTTENRGKQLVVRFKRKASPEAASIPSALKGVVTKASLSTDGKTLTLDLADSYRTRNFISGNMIGIDVLAVGESKAGANDKKALAEKMIEKKSSTTEEVGDEASDDAEDKPNASKKLDPKEAKVAGKPSEKTPVKPVSSPEKNAAANTSKSDKSKVVIPPKPMIEKELAALIPQEKDVIAEDDPLLALEQAATKEALLKNTPSSNLASNALPDPAPTATTIKSSEKVPDNKPVTNEQAQLDKNQQNLQMVLAATQRVKPLNPTIADVKNEGAPVSAVADVAEPTKASVNTEKVKTIAAPAAAITEPAVEPAAPVITPPTEPQAIAAATPSTTDQEVLQDIAGSSPPSTPAAGVVQDAVLRITAQEHPEGLQLNFQTTQRLAAAAYRRSGVVWVWLSTALPIDTNISDVWAARVRIKPVEKLADGMTLLKVEAPSFSGIKMHQLSEGGWALTLTESPTAPKTTIRLDPRVEEGQPAYLLANALESAPPITFKDPALGDEMVVVPVYTEGAGILPARRWIDVELLESAQGIVFKPLADDVTAQIQRNGLAILSPTGLKISPEAVVTGGAANTDNSPLAGETFFPAKEWALEKGETLTSKKQDLQKLFADDEGMQANMARLELAKTYLAEGLFAEAIGVLEDIKGKDLAFYIDQRASALMALANFMMQRYDEAERAFAAPELGESDELTYWKLMLNEYMQGAQTALDYQAFQQSFVHQYPAPVQRKIAFWAVERAVQQEQYNLALSLLKAMDESNVTTAANAAQVEYWKGVIAARNGEPKDAINILEAAMQDVKQREWRARAMIEWVKVQKSLGQITPEVMVDKLEHVRFIWRDGASELQALQMLAELYESQKDYRQALRTLKEIVLTYPRTVQAFKATESMSRLFNFLFNENGDKEMKPLDALTLYYEFKDLTPVEADGDAMIRNLADRLVRVDLLERAAALLDHQVKHRLSGQLRSQVGAQLALIYLLDRKPEKALEALEASGYGANPQDLQRQRARLTARALADLGETERALRLLKDDYAQESQWLKREIYWNQGDWKQVAALAEDSLSQREDPSRPLSLHESETLLKLAVAYTLQNERGQIQYLRDYFTPLMKDSPHKDLFAYITSDAVVTPENMSEVANNIQQMQSFLGNYQQRIQVEGLNAAITSAAANVTSEATSVSPTSTDALSETASTPVPAAPETPADGENKPQEKTTSDITNTTSGQSPAQP